MSELKLTWQELYRAAILETNDAVLPSRVKAAHEALAKRLSDIRERTDRSEERDAIYHAVVALEALINERVRGKRLVPLFMRNETKSA
jgi:hypothetical protein